MSNNFFAQITAQGAKMTSLTKGEFALQNRAQLNILGARAQTQRKYVEGEPREVLHAESLTGGAQAYTQLVGEQANMRSAKTMTGRFTVFGPKCSWSTGSRHNSVYGLNSQMLKQDGTIDDMVVVDFINKISPDIEVVRSRVNRAYNTLTINSLYDNAVAPLLRLYQQRMICALDEVSSKKTVTLTVEANLLSQATSIASSRNIVVKLLEDENIGYSPEDSQLDVWAKELFEYTASASAHVSKEAKRQAKDVKGTVTLSFEAYDCHSYDDGMSKSGNSFMSECGFNSNLFKVAADVTQLTLKEQDRARLASPWGANGLFVSESNISSDGFINVSNLENKEIDVLNAVLVRHVRNTPFLIDQDFDIGISTSRITFIGVPSNYKPSTKVPINSDILASIIGKLVSSHNWYEEGRTAYIMARQWLAQPSTESVQSHWWLVTKRALVVPATGLKRAMIPNLVTTTGVKISQQAVDDSAALTANVGTAVVNSGVFNAMWFWGEYLSVHNGSQDNVIYNNFHSNLAMSLTADNRANALISALSGLTIPTAVFDSCYTLMEGGISSQFRNVVNFGRIAIPEAQEYGYVKSGKNIISNMVVAPSCGMVVLGKAGSLVKGTPYSNAFMVPATKLKYTRAGVPVHMLPFMGMWATNVVCEWQGYVKKYSLAGVKGKHFKSASWENCGLAAPPVVDYTNDEEGDFIVGRTIEGDRVYGADLTANRSVDVGYSWHTTELELLSSLDPQSDVVPGNIRSQELHMTLKTNFVGDNDYMSAMVAVYDVDSMDFRVEQYMLAVPIPSGTDKLQSQEDAIDPTTTTATEENVGESEAA
uniref:Capsid protein n=1 Tax=Red clover powdery mildew-associated totivirus 8 TaxID=1714369 RepID=A0A0S3Q2D1_9VIRU|nr:capsid protein [Red clover powdery mildew-associated totivirus 8]